MQYSATLTAGQTWRQQTAGTFFLLMSTGAAASLDIKFTAQAHELEHIQTASRGLKAKMPDGHRFASVEFTATVACTIVFIISDGSIDIDVVDGATVTIGNTTPILTSNDRGSPGNPVYVNGSIAGNPAAATIVDDAQVAAGAVLGAVVADNANRVSIRFSNLGSNPVALGGAALTWAKAAVIVNPGDTWVEERAANLAWYCICNAGLASTLGVQEVTA